MAKFKERVKMIFQSKIVRALSVIILCIIGMITLGRCNKVDAANFTLSDGTTSKVTYSEGQSLNYSSGTGFGAINNYLQITSTLGQYNIVINSTSSATFTIHNKCSKSNDTITCTNYNSVSTSATTASNYTRTYTFTIGYDYVDVYIQLSNATNRYTISSYNQTDLDNSYQSGYNTGYNEGQESGYNSGYTTGQESGYNTGFTEGQNSVDITQDNQEAIDNYIRDNNYHTNDEYNEYGASQYNKGYDDGESAGFTSGANANIEEAYNNGYSYGYNQGYTSGMSDADNRVNTSSQSYIVGFSAGVGSVDITSDNGDAIVNYITSNNYHSDSDYLNYGKAQYTNGYNEGQYTMINGIINNANEQYKTNIGNVCSDDKSKCNTFIESTNKGIYDKGYNDRDITSDNNSAIQSYLNTNTLYTQKQYDEYGDSKYLEGAETAEGYEIGYNEGYKEGQTDAEVSVLEFFPGIIGAIIGFFITLMQISIFGVRLFDIVGILFGIGLIVLILKVMNGGGD